VLEDAVQVAAELAAEAGGAGLPIAGIGVGVAELVDLEGRVTSGQAIAWAGLPVQERLAQLAPAVVDSDVRTAALAEAVYGAGRPYRSLVYVTVGTGISCCLVVDGRPFPGARGNALVMSSGPWTAACSRCGATTETVLEEFASGPALVARYNAAGAGRAERGEDVLAAVAAGDPAAIEVVATAGEALGNSVGLVVNVLDPGAVIVGGGLGLAGGLYWSRFVASARRHIWAEATRDLPIEPAALGPDAGLIGAAARAANIYAP
jgi:glucokinase